MTLEEFQALRDLPGKVIPCDIHFKPTSSARTSFSFDNVEVENTNGVDVIMNGLFKRNIPTVIYNFYVRAQGPICRVCVNGQMHDGHRTHKHELTKEEDQRLNLPHVIPRPDLENLSPKQVWDILLKAANITHTGKFHSPPP